MKKIFIAALAASALTATPAMAQTATYAVSGMVNASCGGPADAPIAFGTINTTTAGELAGGQSKSITQTPVYCNSTGTTIKITHSALTNTAIAPTGFTSTISYTPVVDFGGHTYTGDQNPAVLLGAAAGDLVVTASMLTATAKPMAGGYTGAIVLTLTPGA